MTMQKRNCFFLSIQPAFEKIHLCIKFVYSIYALTHFLKDFLMVKCVLYSVFNISILFMVDNDSWKMTFVRSFYFSRFEM